MAKANASLSRPDYQAEIPKPFGPTYDVNSVTLAKYRRKPFSELSREERRAYGEAVEKAVLAKQRALLYHEATPDYRAAKPKP